MAQAIATNLAAEVVKGLTKLVAKRAFEKTSLMCWGFDDQLEKLKDKFESIKAFLRVISTSSWNNQDHERNILAYNWLQRVKKLAYLADEVMDDYALEIIRKTKLDSLSRVKGKIYNLKDRPLGFRFNTSGRVAHILSKFDELEKEAINLGLKPIKIAKEVASSHDFDNGDYYNGSFYQARKHAAVSASKLVGRKFEQEKLQQMICKPTGKGSDLSTIAIFGMGGLGKTTLARRLYQDEMIDRHFDKKKVWISVSNNFNVERLLKEMVESLTQKECNLSNTEAIVRKLLPLLQGKKFLLVLDDVWNNKQHLWDSLRIELHSVNYVAGSTILVTTRSRDVSEKARAVCVELKGLSRDESWDLFRQELASETMPVNFHSFEDVGRKIVEKCKGVPLAIKVIACILQSRKQLIDWKAIEKNEVWNLPRENTENQILPSLLLSLRNLQDPALKLCFAYCAIFPKGTSMKKDQLINLWLSQGFLQEHEASTSTLTQEHKVNGESYIQILLNNSLLQEETDHDTIISYKMHDLVHDLANYIMQDDLFEWKERTPMNSEDNKRHLIFNFSRENEMELQANQHKEIMLQKLRTVSFRNGVFSWDLLFLAKYMRTLIMVNIGLTEVSQDIEKLKHLRYLDLSENLIKSLPESICELYQLQTLRLLHCSQLTKLPKNLHKLINLRHLLTSNCMHVSKRSMQQLTTLQTLPKLELRDGKGWTIDELGCLPTVKGEICISRLEHVQSIEQARKANLGSKDKISKLDLRWGESREESSYDAKYNNGGILDGLEPHPNIKSISIRDYRHVSFPEWFMTMTVKQDNRIQLSNLTVVELQRCRMLKHLPTLGELPSLSYLKLEEFDNVKCIDTEFYQTPSHAIKVLFPALRHLRIKHFPLLTNWKSPSSSLSAFTSLESLEVRECHFLETVPTLNYQSLRDLELENIGSSQPLNIIKNNNKLNSLHLTNIPKMTTLPIHLLNCTNLQILEIHRCANLESFTTWQHTLLSLKKLRISDCIALTSLPDDLFYGGLVELSIDSCYGLANLPLSLENCASLQHMRVKNCPSIRGPVPNLCMLEGLLRLTMLNTGCMMASVLQSIPHLHNLHDLEIGGFEDDEECRKYFLEMAAPLSSQSLIRLVLRDFPRVTFLPQQLQCLISIECLYIDSFALQELPDWIGNFSSLEELRLSSCKKLTSLASKEVMLSLSHLKRLYIDDCPFLEMRCAQEVCAERVHIMFDDDDI